MDLTASNMGQLVRQQRVACGMTQGQLAERAGCSQRLVSELERGSAARIDKVIDVFDALGLRLVVQPAGPDAGKELAALKERVAKTLDAKAPGAKTIQRKLSDYL